MGAPCRRLALLSPSPPPRPVAPLRLVAPRRAAPSPPSGGRSLVGWAVGGFFFPPPRPRPSSPRQDRDTVGDSRVLTPWGPPSSLGVESSHDELTPPPFVCGVESSCHDSTPPHPPLGVESSRDDSTPPPFPWRVESSGDNSTPPQLFRGPSRGFPPLRRPRGPPPPFPLRGDQVPLQRSRRPPEFPPTP